MYRNSRRMLTSGILMFALMALTASTGWAQVEDEPADDQAPPAVEEAPALDEPMEDQEITSPDLLTVLEEHGQFTQLIAELERSGLIDSLAMVESYTLFAPTDEAFAAFTAERPEGVSPEELTEILRYHVVPQSYAAQDLAGVTEIVTLRGDNLAVGDQGSTIGGATVTMSEIQTDGGVVYVIDRVLTPEEEALTQ